MIHQSFKNLKETGVFKKSLLNVLEKFLIYLIDILEKKLMCWVL